GGYRCDLGLGELADAAAQRLMFVVQVWIHRFSYLVVERDPRGRSAAGFHGAGLQRGPAAARLLDGDAEEHGPIRRRITFGQCIGHERAEKLHRTPVHLPVLLGAIVRDDVDPAVDHHATPFEQRIDLIDLERDPPVALDDGELRSGRGPRPDPVVVVDVVYGLDVDPILVAVRDAPDVVAPEYLADRFLVQWLNVHIRDLGHGTSWFAGTRHAPLNIRESGRRRKPREPQPGAGPRSVRLEESGAEREADQLRAVGQP